MNFEEILRLIPIQAYIFFGIFIVCSIYQLVLAFLEKEQARIIEKPACLFSLSIAALLALPDQPFIYIGALLGMVGDVLVIIRHRKYFNLGVFFFLLGHISYMLEIFIILLKCQLPWYYFVILAACFIVFFLVLFFISKRFAKDIKEALGLSFYYGILFIFLPIMIIAYIQIGSFMYLGIIGVCIFIVSDIIILITKYGQKFKRYNFYIMLPYLIAQFLIVNCLIFTYISL